MTTTATATTAECRDCGARLAIDTTGRATAIDVPAEDHPETCPCSRDRVSGHRIATEPAPMAEVEVGDVLWESGLRCEVTEVRTWDQPASRHGAPARTLHVARTRILNVDYLASEAGRYLFGGIIARDGSDGWTFQGIPSRTVPREVRG